MYRKPKFIILKENRKQVQKRAGPGAGAITEDAETRPRRQRKAAALSSGRGDAEPPRGSLDTQQLQDTCPRWLWQGSLPRLHRETGGGLSKPSRAPLPECRGPAALSYHHGFVFDCSE